MNLGVIGCGNVGFAFLLWLDKLGHNVLGYDIDPIVKTKIRESIGGDSLAESMQDFQDCDGLFICVPTEPNEDGSADMHIFESVLDELRKVEFTKKVAIIQRSTCIPGSADKYEKMFGDTVSYAVNPSFLRKSSITFDTENPERVAIGGTGFARDLLKKLYSQIDAPRFITDSKTCVELLKYAENTMDALLISYWNEMSTFSKAIGISNDDFVLLLERFCDRDKFKSTVRIPGKAFGKWCLPKDLRALIVEMNRRDIPSSVLDGTYEVNKRFTYEEGIGEIPAQELVSFSNGDTTILSKGKQQIEEYWRHG